MLEVVKVSTADLEVGMYVSNLDRPWLETPFMIQGFRLESKDDIQRLQRFCRYVYVDTQKSRQANNASRPRITRPRRPTQELFPKRKLQVYEDANQWSDEYPRALEAVESLSGAIEDIFSDVSKGQSVDIVKAKKSVEPMIDSITRNPDACIWLARMKQEDQYTYQHSLGASIWAVALGRQLGLPKSDLRTLAVGGLLFDVGKLRVDKELLNTERPLTDEEFEQVRDHVRHGVEMLEGGALMNQDVLDMVACHHERHDGSGYPKGLRGDDIPVFARIAAIVDCYDPITSHRSYARALPPAEAIKMLYEWRDREFQLELVEEFIQAIGIYPAGTLVELSSGEIAVVVAEYRTRRLRPRVLALMGADKAPLATPRIIDLLTETHTADNQPLDIISSLEPDAYGIDMTAINL